MEIRISPRLNAVLEYAREEAMRTGSYAIAVDHLTLGILRDADNDACRTLVELGVSLNDLKNFIDSQIFCDKSVPFNDSDKIAVSRGASSAINLATMEALKAGVQEVCPAHLLLAISRIPGNAGQAFIDAAGITPEILCDRMSREGRLKSGAKNVTPSPEEVSHIIKLASNNSKIFS